MIFAFAGCKQESDQTLGTVTNSSTTNAQTTTEPETELVTHESTKIAVTRKIYPVLSKDFSDSYTYLMSEYTSKFDSSIKSRTTNLNVSANVINDIVLQPNEIFSFNQVVGKRTVTRGYQSAKVVVNGEFEDGLGGGVCQVSSTLFNAVLLSNLEIVERTNHSVKITYVPTGYDATVQWNTKDFQFKNNYDFPIKLKMFCNGSKLTAQIYSQSPVTIQQISLSLETKDGAYILHRTADGVLNYTTKSKYK